MMKYRGVNFQIIQALCLLLYYCFAFYLPISGKYYNIGGSIRAWLCKRIFKECGNHVNIERKTTFGSGRNFCIIGGGCVLTKVFPEYSIVGGNPSKLIRSRLVKNE